MILSIRKGAFIFTNIEAFLALIYGINVGTPSTCTSEISLGRYLTWEDAPSSRDEFDHGNDKRLCGLPIVSVEQWEAGRLWEGEQPVIVKNVTDGWKALEHWTK